uniref:Uncharacterized protein n=1 Tax=Rhizophora mucronata TaxID=61149 RepID=A0A2P2QKS3_RHIMU
MNFLTSICYSIGIINC